MEELQIGDKTEGLGTVLMKCNTRGGVVHVFSNENNYNENCVDLEQSDSVSEYGWTENFDKCLEKFEWVQNLWGNIIDDNEIINCILSEAHSDEYEEVVKRILNYEDLMHKQASIGDVKKIIMKVREEDLK